MKVAVRSPEVEVNEVDAARVSTCTEHKIRWLDIAVKDATRMDMLHRRELHWRDVRHRSSFENEIIGVGRPFAVPSLRSFFG